ncbi:MAG: SRPBCC family protein [Thermoplasmata archaeon]
MPTEKARGVSHQYFIRASPQRTFDAIANPAMLVKWLADQAQLSPQRGGDYLLGWTDGPTHTGKVLEFEPGKRIAFAWGWPGVSLRETVFRLSVEPKDDGSLLLVEHEGFPKLERWTDLYGGAEWGWTYFAMNLKSVLEHGHDLRSEFDG